MSFTLMSAGRTQADENILNCRETSSGGLYSSLKLVWISY